MTDDERDWLKTLSDEIWKQTAFNPLPRYGPPSMYEETRNLSWEEWVKLQGIIQRSDLLVEMLTIGFGFYIGIRLIEEGPPVYPGVPPQLTQLILVSAKHLPEDLIPEGAGRHFDAGWTNFSPLTHTDENEKRLVQAGLPPPRPAGHYAY